MKKGLMKTMALLSSLAVLMTGCGSGSGGGSSSAGGTDTKAPAASSGSTEAGSTSAADSVLKDGVDTELLVIFPGASSAPASLSEVEDQMNTIVKEKMDAHVKLQVIEWGAVTDQYNLMLSSGEKVDLLFSTDTKNYASRGQLTDIKDMIQTYAPGAYGEMSAYLDACYVGDGLYGVPSFHDLASSVGLCCRTDILEEVGADPASIKTWDDVTALLDKVKDKYPNMSLLVPNTIGNGILYPMMSTAFEEIEAGVGTIVGSDSTTVENLYASDEFKEICNKAYEWNKKGYFISDAVTVTETRGALVKAGNAFGYVANIYPGFEVQESQDCGYNMTCINIDPATAHTSSVTVGQWVVPTACETPEKALAFVDLLYTNADIQNLFFYGIEGTDYVIEDAEKGIITYPEGKDSTSVGWANQMWITGNATIGYKWSSQDPDIWEKLKSFNDTAQRSSIYGFVYDTSNVKNEITAITNVESKYIAILVSGAADVDSTIDQFISELESAGIQNIIDDMQQQINAWLGK